MKRLSRVVRSGHGGRMGNNTGKEDPVISDRLRAEDFVFTKVCEVIYSRIDRSWLLVCTKQMSN